MNMSGWEPRNLSASASAHLDVIRAAAAWAVMWGHLRTLFFVDFQHLHSPGWLLGGPVFLHWVRTPSGDGIFCLKRVSDFSDGH